MADQQTPSQAIPIRVALVDTTGAIIGSLPVTIADNGDFALGSVADAQWSGVGSATAIAILKKIAVTGVGGGPATIADGADVTQGAKADTAWDGAAASASVVAILKKAVGVLTAGIAVSWAAAQHVILDAGTAEIGNVKNSGTFAVQATLASTTLSATVLPTGAAVPTDGVVTATVPGAPVQLPTVAAKLVALTASPRNVDDVVLGSATVSASRSARSGLPLSPGDSVTMPLTNLNDLYLDCRYPGDSLSYLVLA